MRLALKNCSLLVLLAVLSACGIELREPALQDGESTERNQICTMIAVAGINIRGQIPAGQNPAVFRSQLVVKLDSVALSDLGSGGSDLSFSGAFEQQGTFNLEVSHPSYGTAVRSRIVVSLDDSGCHVKPVILNLDFSTVPLQIR